MHERLQAPDLEAPGVAECSDVVGGGEEVGGREAAGEGAREGLEVFVEEFEAEVAVCGGGGELDVEGVDPGPP